VGYRVGVTPTPPPPPPHRSSPSRRPWEGNKFVGYRVGVKPILPRSWPSLERTFFRVSSWGYAYPLPPPALRPPRFDSKCSSYDYTKNKLIYRYLCFHAKRYWDWENNGSDKNRPFYVTHRPTWIYLAPVATRLGLM